MCLLIVWGVTLWFLSAGNPAPKQGPDIPHLDKLAHFLYFFVGGSLLAAHVGFKWAEINRWRLFLIVALVCCVMGRLDEYHQGFTPGRSGNDIGDWLADTLGGAAGAWWVIFVMMPRVRGFRQSDGLNEDKVSI